MGGRCDSAMVRARSARATVRWWPIAQPITRREYSYDLKETRWSAQDAALYITPSHCWLGRFWGNLRKSKKNR